MQKVSFRKKSASCEPKNALLYVIPIQSVKKRSCKKSINSVKNCNFAIILHITQGMKPWFSFLYKPLFMTLKFLTLKAENNGDVFCFYVLLEKITTEYLLLLFYNGFTGNCNVTNLLAYGSLQSSNYTTVHISSQCPDTFHDQFCKMTVGYTLSSAHLTLILNISFFALFY